MSVHSLQKKRRKDYCKLGFKTMGNHNKFLERITKTLYYGELPITERFSLPVTELAAEIYSEVKCGFSLERLRPEEAAEISRTACVSPCSFVLAMLYLEQLKTCNPIYVEKVASSELFLISLMVASKFLNDSGEEDDVLNSEWASSAGLSLRKVNQLEKEFLNAINWEVFVRESSFWLALRGVEKTIALKEGKKRGWFTYTDLELLLDCIDGLAVAQAIFTMSAICLASYAAGMLTVIGSTLLATQLSSACLMYHTNQTESIFTISNTTDAYHTNVINGTDDIFDCGPDVFYYIPETIESLEEPKTINTTRKQSNIQNEFEDYAVIPNVKQNYFFPLNHYMVTGHSDFLLLEGAMSH